MSRPSLASLLRCRLGGRLLRCFRRLATGQTECRICGSNVAVNRARVHSHRFGDLAIADLRQRGLKSARRGSRAQRCFGCTRLVGLLMAHCKIGASRRAVAALDTLKRAEPFPPPDSLKGERIDLTIPVRFDEPRVPPIDPRLRVDPIPP